MGVIVNLDVEMSKKKISSGELAQKVGITQANLSILKTNKAKAIRFSTLAKISCPTRVRVTPFLLRIKSATSSSSSNFLIVCEIAG